MFDENEISVHRNTPVPLAKCDICKTRRRVLPVEILPYKTYSLPLMETTCNLYRLESDGLRSTVRKIPGISPHYTTLHGWIGGIGEKALDRVRLCNERAMICEPFLPPSSALLAETAKKKKPDLISQWYRLDIPIPSFKYKSPFRREVVEACFKLLYVAILLFQEKNPLTKWETFLLSVFKMPCFLFSSRNIVTAIQLTDTTDNMLLCDELERGPP